MNKSTLFLGLTCLSFGALGCEGESELVEISSTQAALTASENAELALQGVIDAGDFLASSTSIAKALNAFGGRGQTCESSVVLCENGAQCPEPETVCTPIEVSEEDLEEARQEMRESAANLVRQLRERILIEDNLESSTATSATYRLGADVLCDDDAVPPAAPGADSSDAQSSFDVAVEVEYDCAEQVGRLQPRLVLTSPREGDIDVTLQLGAGRREPLALELYRESLGVRVDLNQGVALARELGEGLDGLLELQGVLEWQLVRNAARDYSIEFNVLEALSAEIEADGDTLTTSLAASSPAWNVRINGNTSTLSAGLDMGALRVAGPLRLFAGLFGGDEVRGEVTGATGDSLGAPPLPPADPEPEPREYTGVIDLLLAGLSGTVSYSADSDVLSFTDLGFGDTTSTVKLDEETLLGLDLNALSGRRVNLEVSPSEDGAEIRISPSFDLKIELAFRHIADQFEGIADYLLDDTLRVWFDGDAPAIAVGDDQLRVTSGTLHVSSEAYPSVNVDVEAGMCLAGEIEATSGDSEGTDNEGADSEGAGGTDTESDGESDPGHPFASLAAVACE